MKKVLLPVCILLLITLVPAGCGGDSADATKEKFYSLCITMGDAGDAECRCGADGLAEALEPAQFAALTDAMQAAADAGDDPEKGMEAMQKLFSSMDQKSMEVFMKVGADCAVK